jgi:hypothetical protein
LVDEKDIEKKKRQKKGWCRFNKKPNPQDGEVIGGNSEEKDAKKNIPFIIFELQMTKKSYEEKIGSLIRIERIKAGIQEFFIQVESDIVNDNFKFVIETLQVFNIKPEENRVAESKDFEKAQT